MKKTVTIQKQALSVITFCFTLISFAQTPSWSLITQTSGPGNEHLRAVTTDAQGNIFFSGTLSDDFDFEGQTAQYRGGFLWEAFVARKANNGANNWVASIGGDSTGFVGARGIAADQDGNVMFIVDGGFASAGDTMFIGNNYFELFTCNQLDLIVKMDSMGNVLWTKQIGDSACNGSIANPELVIDSDGNFYIAGFVLGSVQLDSFQVSQVGSWDGQFLAKGDANGNFLWAKSFGCKGNDGQQFKLEMSDNNEVFLSGGWEGDTLFIDNLFLVNPNQGGFFNTERYICKFDTSGMAVWMVNEGGLSSDSPALMIPLTDGGVACNSQVFDGSSVTINEGGVTVNGGVFLITKYDALGNFKSYHTYAFNNGNGLYGFVGDGTDYYMEWAYNTPTYSFGGITLQNAGGTNGTHDGGVAKVDSAGNIIWAVSIGGLEEEFLFGLHYSANRGLLIGGKTYSDELVVGYDTIQNAGFLTSEVFVATLKSGIGIQENEFSTMLKLYPIPAKDVLHLDFEGFSAKEARVTIISATGKVMIRENLNSLNDSQIVVKDLMPGVYILEVGIGKNYAVKKFIKQ